MYVYFHIIKLVEIVKLYLGMLHNILIILDLSSVPSRRSECVQRQCPEDTAKATSTTQPATRSQDSGINRTYTPSNTLIVI